MNPAAPRVVKPAARWYVVGVVVLVVGLAAGIWQYKRSVPDGSDTIEIDHKGDAWFEHAGSYSLYVFRRASKRTDLSTQQTWDAARTVQVGVTRNRTGDRLSVKNVYETVEMQNNKLARLVEFDVPAQGWYRVQIMPYLTRLTPLISPSRPIDQVAAEIFGLLFGVVLAFAIGGVGVIAGGAILLITFLRRRRAKQAAAAETR